MKVKALEWTSSDPQQNILRRHHTAVTPFGKYVITQLSVGCEIIYRIDESFTGRHLPFDSLDQAKARCQQEFDQLIHQCLTPL